METKQLTCEQRVKDYYNDTLKTICDMLKGKAEDYPKDSDPYRLLNEYGLGIDYVQAGTFTDQEIGYIRWQLSWGGPSDEFRFYLNNQGQPRSIEYWFLDWFDGAMEFVTGEDFQTLLECWDMLLMDEIDRTEEID